VTNRTRCIPVVCLLAAYVSVAGCSQQTIESAASDAQRNAAVVEREAKRAERKARPQLGKLDRGARVTAALKLNKKLPSTIRVDAGEDSVRLRGTVRSEEEKELAGRVARDAVDGGVSVSNELTVSEGGE
jgi:osmotically-inducible protein OsmY